jgi:hypothetical protein
LTSHDEDTMNGLDELPEFGESIELGTSSLSLRGRVSDVQPCPSERWDHLIALAGWNIEGAWNAYLDTQSSDQALVAGPMLNAATSKYYKVEASDFSGTLEEYSTLRGEETLDEKINRIIESDWAIENPVETYRDILARSPYFFIHLAYLSFPHTPVTQNIYCINILHSLLETVGAQICHTNHHMIQNYTQLLFYSLY